MITTNNYFTEIRKIDLLSLPEPSRKGHEFVAKATGNGDNWNSYGSSDTIKKAIDIYLSKLNEFVQQQTKTKPEEKTNKVHPGKCQPSKRKEKKQKEVVQTSTTLVERIPEEIKFIRRYLTL